MKSGSLEWYQYWFLKAELKDNKEDVFAQEYIRKKMLSGQIMYTSVEMATGIPWVLVGAIHCLESAFDFSRHLHNGDPLIARTVNVPRGRPLIGKPPFQWKDSAVDALKDRVKGNLKSIPAMLQFAEAYNGVGYLKLYDAGCSGYMSPYVWGGTDIYTSGKYVRDGQFDKSAVSKQYGVAATLKTLLWFGVYHPSQDANPS